MTKNFEHFIPFSCFLNYLVEWQIVGPDQTAPKGAVWSGSLLFAYILSETGVRSFRTFTL